MNAGGVQIRAAAADDAAALGRLHLRCWHETYTGLVPQALLAQFTLERSCEIWEHILRGPTAHAAAKVYLLDQAATPLEPDGLAGFGACCAQRTVDLADRGFDAEISSIYLLKSCQRRGWGALLFDRLAHDLLSRGFRGMSLWVHRDNAPAHGFYLRHGGTVVGEKREVREHGTLHETAYGWPRLSALRAQLAPKTAPLPR